MAYTRSGKGEVIVSNRRNSGKEYSRRWMACVVLGIAFVPAAVRAQAMFVAGFVPAGRYQVEQSFDGEPKKSFEFCFPAARPEDVFSFAGCVNEWDKTQAGLTQFKSTCSNIERTITVRQVDARTWETTEQVLVRPPDQAQVAANMAALRPGLERQARNGNAKEQAGARRALAEIDGLQAKMKAAPPATWDAFQPQKVARRLKRIAERCDFGKQK
ncbi:MAG: hypothetical protein JWP72_951 [Massilia sp.]|nr:hypothetical protein [Massilia sp.]